MHTDLQRFLIVGNIFQLETCMHSLVKVPPYSKLNFQGTNFITQDWCNITLKYLCIHNRKKTCVNMNTYTIYYVRHGLIDVF